MAPDGRIFLPDVKQGTEVEFAVRVGVHHGAGSTPETRTEVWLNNHGHNYRQVAR